MDKESLKLKIPVETNKKGLIGGGGKESTRERNLFLSTPDKEIFIHCTMKEYFKKVQECP